MGNHRRSVPRRFTRHSGVVTWRRASHRRIDISQHRVVASTRRVRSIQPGLTSGSLPIGMVATRNVTDHPLKSAFVPVWQRSARSSSRPVRGVRDAEQHKASLTAHRPLSYIGLLHSYSLLVCGTCRSEGRGPGNVCAGRRRATLPAYTGEQGRDTTAQRRGVSAPATPLGDFLPSARWIGSHPRGSTSPDRSPPGDSWPCALHRHSPACPCERPPSPLDCGLSLGRSSFRIVTRTVSPPLSPTEVYSPRPGG